jgi:hypothetical protein
MEQLEEPLAEHVLQRRIKEYGPRIWADLMRKLNEVVHHIKINKHPKAPTKSRLVDFNVFCDRIKKSSAVDGNKLMLGLLSMIDSQLRQLKESSQAVTLIEEWISLRPNEAEEWHSYQELFSILQSMCQARRVDLKWRNVIGLSRHLSTLRSRLEQDFGAEFKEQNSTSGPGTVTKMRFVVKI